MTLPTSSTPLRPILILVTAIAAIWFSGRVSGQEFPLAYDGQSMFYSHDTYGLPQESTPIAATNVAVFVQPVGPAMYDIVRPNTFGMHRRRLSRHRGFQPVRSTMPTLESRLRGPVLVDTLWTGR